MKNFLLTHKTWLLTLAVGAISFLTPSINTFVASHPQYAVTIGTLWGVAAAWAKSPKA